MEAITSPGWPQGVRNPPEGLAHISNAWATLCGLNSGPSPKFPFNGQMKNLANPSRIRFSIGKNRDFPWIAPTWVLSLPGSRFHLAQGSLLFCRNET